VVDGRALWEEVRDAPLPPRVSNLEPMRSALPPVLLVLAGLAAAALAAYFWLPRQLRLQAPAAPTAAASAEVAPQEPPQLEADRARLARRVAALEARGASAWGGPDFAAAKRRAAESAGARDGGTFSLSQQRLTEAALLLDMVERSAPVPKNVQPSAELARANAPPANESYAAAAGEGFAALGAGRLEEARAAFERARALRPEGSEAADGLRRVSAATGQAGIEDNPGAGHAARAGDVAADRTAAGNAKAVAQARAYALSLEAQERWENATSAYATILRHDHSLSFAREGEARAQARQDLNDDLQAMLDRPDRLANSQQVRDRANALLQEARAQPSPGPVLSSQIARLTALLPNSGKAVHIALVSDGVTQVEIPSVGTFGSFSRRDIQLRPGHYTVIGTRAGYRDARRDIVVSPERENQTVIVSCSEPT
jgi:hypothetical protein